MEPKETKYLIDSVIYTCDILCYQALCLPAEHNLDANTTHNTDLKDFLYFCSDLPGRAWQVCQRADLSNSVHTGACEIRPSQHQMCHSTQSCFDILKQDGPMGACSNV